MQLPFLVLVKSTLSTDTHLYGVLAADEEQASSLVLDQFEKDQEPDDIAAWSTIVLVPDFTPVAYHIARLDDGL